MGSWKEPERNLDLKNQWVQVRALDYDRDVDALYATASLEANGEDIFRYSLGAGPFTTREAFGDYLRGKAARQSELTCVVFSYRLNRLVGSLSLLNVRADHGSLEVGSIWYCTAAQRSEINTNAMHLLFRHIFEEMQYRRLEWKCNNANAASKTAALRLGFSPEGVFRNHFWDKGKNRDTAWYSIIDSEWPRVKHNFQEQLLRRY